MPFGSDVDRKISTPKPHNGEPFCALRSLQRLTIATGNPIKVAEIEAMLGPVSYTHLTLPTILIV